MMKSGSDCGGRKLDYWRDFFGGDNKNIFDIIKNSILIAAADFPKEFESQRDQIAQTLFTCGTARCHNCNSLELHLAKNEICEFRDGDGGRIEDGGKESKVNSSTTNDLIGNCSYEDVEALTEEIMEENQIVTEVYRIKEILINKNDEVFFMPKSLLFFACMLGVCINSQFEILTYYQIHDSSQTPCYMNRCEGFN